MCIMQCTFYVIVTVLFYILLHLVRILEELIKKPLRLVNGFLNICNFCTVIVTLKFTGQYMNEEVNF